MKTKIENKVSDLLIQVSSLALAGELEVPEIKFDLKGQNAGSFRVMGDKCTLRFNFELLKENKKDFLRYIVPHEVAHYVTFRLYGRVRPHGKEWRNIMRFLGIENPRRCHSFNVHPWIYRCGCREHYVSQRQHSWILKGKKAYRCRDCKEKIEFVGKRS